MGAIRDDDGGINRGAVWVLFLNTDGTVKSHQKISDTQGGFTGILDDVDVFGGSVASLGDLDGDGVGDLAVGAIADDDGGSASGAVWVLFLDTNGTVNIITRTSITLTQEEADAWTAGDPFRLRLERVAADGGDTLVGDAEVIRVLGRQ